MSPSLTDLLDTLKLNLNSSTVTLKFWLEEDDTE